MNHVSLIGNLTRDPELRHTPGGSAVCNMRIAVNDRRKENNEWTDVPYYFDVTVWGNQGESCAQFLSKGKKVGISGKLTWREWNANDGTKRQSVEITAFQVDFLTPRGDSGGGSQAGAFVPAAASADYSPQADSSFGADDDIPF
jgi:single-strand DNA-binding protein